MLMHDTPLSERCKGRWESILPQLGIETSFLTRKNGPCPFCAGKDRWRFLDTDQHGTWVCTHCGGGDGAELIKRRHNVEFAAAAKLIEGVLGETTVQKPKPRRSAAVLRADMKRAWDGAKPLTAGCIAGRYLASRGVVMAEYPRALRFSTRWPSPAMIAQVIAPSGKAANVHRTFLRLDGSGKADIPKPKVMMEGLTPVGSVVRLGKPNGKLAIAEGIEDALSVTVMSGTVCWAALGTANLAAFKAPEGIEELEIWGNFDDNYAGQAALYACARDNFGRFDGRLKVTVRAPDRPGDWNDQLRAWP
jgi:putative DNA primase/helicase